MDLLKLLVAAGADLKATQQDGRNALHLAAAAESPEAVRFLLDQKMGVNALSDLGETALMNAAAAGRLETVTLLLRAGASVNEAERNVKKTALMAP
jgi:ankyrin